MPPLIASRKHTVHDYLMTPDGPPWYELIDGQLIEEPSPTTDHQDISRELAGSLWVWNRKAKAGQFWFAPSDVVLSEHDVLQPDLYFIQKSRLAIVRDGRTYGPPDLVVEILSPANARLNRLQKKAIYARHGVKEMWMIDPPGRIVHVYRFERDAGRPARTFGAGDILASPLLPGFSVPVGELFGGF